MSYGVIVALEDEGCSFDYFPSSHKPLDKRRIKKKNIKLLKGQILIFHAWLIHAGFLCYYYNTNFNFNFNVFFNIKFLGSSYKLENYRFHMYIYHRGLNEGEYSFNKNTYMIIHPQIMEKINWPKKYEYTHQPFTEEEGKKLSAEEILEKIKETIPVSTKVNSSKLRKRKYNFNKYS